MGIRQNRCTAVCRGYAQSDYLSDHTYRPFRIVEEAVITLKLVSGSANANTDHNLMISRHRADNELLISGVGFIQQHFARAEDVCKMITRYFEKDIIGD